ncbi:sensor histidine kinase [Haladaptatus sp. GCM10025707]|uniref:sensor histidine kinase n=1 Tax=unclassified Haladaptatus TaxID=2622732 RepID=UPI0023E81378|nr:MULTISPECIES: HAMP domain-containing sensor histidine kinase [unclassified Haladaptatus]
MTVIRGCAEHLVERLDSGEDRRHAETIVRWSNDVVDIVQRVSTIIQTVIGSSTVPLTSVNLSERIDEEVTRVRSTYPDVTFETDVPPDVHARGNDLLSEVIGNVLTNVIRHNDTEKLQVTVTVETDEQLGTVRTRIADTGTGIADDQKEAVFRRGHSGRPSGGFGLFFVDTMVRAVGGDVWVEDNDPTGAVFVIELLQEDAENTPAEPTPNEAPLF